MKVICQRCNQILPKTAVMCPNCGNRSFAPIDEHQANQYLQQRLNPPAQSVATAATPVNPWHIQQPPAMPPSSQPSPIAGRSHTDAYQTPINQTLHPVQPQPTYQAPPPPVAAPPSYPPAVPSLPASYANGRKLASSMHYAGFLRRGFAYGFDLVLVGLLLALAYQLGLPKLEDYLGVRAFSEQSLAAAGVACYLCYMAFFTSVGRQATIGKIIMGLWVFGMQGQRINFFQALFREVIKVLLLPFFFIMWFTARKQTLADFMARTVVLYDPS